ncbi:Leucine-, isoleucine-, valine-, threonine-, and alanine-binding protein precursor [Thalassovita gelatinovora]|uniref:Leucine-, isoleucine-, valine-, threonine-, and alanine-binding protein n=1 Tax=Thalassovita gelatinovora TaxID=53501 RepID=A0A0P1FYK3_THAGE|nr:branched-chain amino acid ABC transporter substrate-binding protein [Thalassovita gelatinovora]QIZ80759.1 branched-chain amino acid ABC transporter substrate-binding protein [Thalassovita gelatinovora]CUH65408.1 Leucine-, isoleucine-, valine-, threonine-, and alanine-binding protein precursor [Thalassovita gelatinovora]SEQ90643.1 amino acid/amide ABC transporter substrate-binding protein, HAAT family [Thalassovita gelatinovora]
MRLLSSAALAAVMSVTALSGASADTLKIAFIDPLSGPFGPTGQDGLNEWEYAAEQINAKGGINGNQVEVTGYDNKVNPKESLVQLQKALDNGVRYIAQGNGSSVASALIDAITKHNKRNPGEEVLFLNYAAVDPSFTNDRCNFWHFRFDADSDMKMEAITDWVKGQEDIKKVYIIGQDYSFGKAVAAAAEKNLTEKRPDIEIVGNELHPLGKVKDFTPYVQKIISSGADAMITGNWGADMVLLIKAAIDSGFDGKILTYYGGSRGAATAMGQAAVGQVMAIVEHNTNLEMSDAHAAYVDGYEAKYSESNYYYQRIDNAMHMLAMAAEKADSIDPVDVAFALEGMTYEGPTGTLTMRADNHQVLQPMFMSTFSDNVARGVDNGPFGWVADDAARIEAEDTRTETTCQMTRPSK